MNRRYFLYLGTACAAGTAVGLIAAQRENPPQDKGMLLELPDTDKLCRNCKWWDEIHPRWFARIGLHSVRRGGFCRIAPPVSGWPTTRHFERCSRFERKDPENEKPADSSVPK